MYTRKVSILFFSLGIAVLIALAGTNSVIAQEEGLILYLPFDEGSGETAEDHSPTGLDGTVKGNAEWVEGIEGGAISFDGATAYVNLPASDVLHEANQHVTFSLWFNARDIEVGGAPDWAAMDTLLVRGNDTDFWFYLAWGFVGTQMKPGGSWIYPPEKPPFEIETDRWYYAVAVYDDPTSKVYLDGELVFEQKGVGGIIDYRTDNWTQIGGFRGQKNWFNGVIDEVKIYNRALTPKEIRGVWPVTLKDKLTTTWGRTKDKDKQVAQSRVPLSFGWRKSK